jgi:hypothetical protein
MSDILADIWDWIRRLFGWRPEPTAIRIADGQHVYMPLFYAKANGQAEGTWNYLALDDAHRAQCRAQILAGAVDGEVPAITFCLTPNDLTFGLWGTFPALNPDGLPVLRVRLEELIADGIAAMPCLYIDDPVGSMPRWWDIAKQPDCWRAIHDAIGHLVTGYILSIESNERTSSVHQLASCVDTLRTLMPGVQYYGTHLQWQGAGQNGYRWTGNTSTPTNLDIILVETTWHPMQGDRVGVDGLSKELTGVVRACPGKRLVIHEYNLNPAGVVCAKQRYYLRGQGVWGVG